jgi:Spy/CpxP family protein refolding chaperone
MRKFTTALVLAAAALAPAASATAAHADTSRVHVQPAGSSWAASTGGIKFVQPNGSSWA